MMKTCKGYHLDANESALLSDICTVCGPSLALSYKYTVAHTVFTFLMWNFVSRRTDKRKDSPLNKQVAALMSIGSVYTGVEASKLDRACNSALSSFSIPAFKNW
eukprot:CAMPEP_0118643100 /NCGR_PEP_ID=MMETSP0785-20121206/6210_1 /TAXON_ID=91992 /ORGANISM="Bolidomonas pacifica, Strain CCMP 1866" /LENGTH=103 /DNA_ID=CAMNT_0006534739 /DNA_START=335 /DNA_END=643 /DNA_ORIENTATION=-